MARISAPQGGPVTGAFDFFVDNQLDSRGYITNTQGELILSASNNNSIYLSATDSSEAIHFVGSVQEMKFNNWLYLYGGNLILSGTGNQEVRWKYYWDISTQNEYVSIKSPSNHNLEIFHGTKPGKPIVKFNTQTGYSEFSGTTVVEGASVVSGVLDVYGHDPMWMDLKDVHVTVNDFNRGIGYFLGPVVSSYYPGIEFADVTGSGYFALGSYYEDQLNFYTWNGIGATLNLEGPATLYSLQKGWLQLRQEFYLILKSWFYPYFLNLEI